MPKYIELEATKIAIHNMDAGRREKSTLLSPEEFTEYLDEFPAADVAPVVRCKDCQNCQGMHGVSGVLLCMNHLGTVLPDDFCSYGKRKDAP